MNDRLWMKNYERAKEYYKVNGNLLIPYRYETEDGFGLGRWVNNLRYQVFDEKKKKLLDDIGMVWSMKNVESFRNTNKQWLKKYKYARTYYLEHNNLYVPNGYKTNDGFELYDWLLRQKDLYERKVLNSEQIRLLEEIEIDWNMTYNLWIDNSNNKKVGRITDVWYKNYELAKKYYNEHGNLFIPKTYVTDKGINLGVWLANQKAFHNQNMLSNEKIELLEQIKIVWSIRQSKKKNQLGWSTYYDIASKYYKKYGNLLIPTLYETNDGIKLGQWIHNNRQAYKNNKLSKEKIDLLEEIGMIWSEVSKDNTKETWMKRYNLLKKHYSEFNNLIVYNRIELDPFLARWINQQKQLFLDKKLSQKQIDLLYEIGILNKSNRDIRWMLKYDLAKKYYEKYGDLKISVSFITSDGINYDKNGVKLGHWIRTLREAYNGSDRKALTNEQIELLENIGMIWNFSENDHIVLTPNWYKNYELAKEYFNKHNTLLVPYSYKVNGGFRLGSWIFRQRELYAENRLSEKQIELLNNIKMVWDIEQVKKDRMKEKEVLKLFKRYLLKFNRYTLPSKEKLNEGFIKVLSRGDKNV